MFSKYLFDLALELPVFVVLEGMIVQRADGDTELSCAESFGGIAFSHFFFGPPIA